ncbi:MAG: RIP metalloprotease RseP [bacterium]
MEFLIKAGQLILSLSILIILHESGHFMFAKLFKTRVEKFYLFFNPWFSLFKFKKGETEYGLGWLPLGGYVKISGMIDESMDKEQMKKPPQPHEFRSKPAWQRLLIMLGGVSMNFLTAIIIFILVLYSYGRAELPTENMKYGVMWDSLALEHGFKNGDKIVSINGQTVENLADINKLIAESPQQITVSRDGSLKKIELPSNFMNKVIEQEAIPLFEPILLNIIDSVIPNSAAAKIGLQSKDKIISINGKSTPYFNRIGQLIRGNTGKEISLTIVRQNDTLQEQIKVPEKGIIGIAPPQLEYNQIDYGLAESIPAGIESGWSTLAGYVSQMKYVFTKEGFSKIGGFGTIGNLFPASWNWYSFWNLTAILSIILAFMNILPIPALDGGHVLFLLYEMISGRKPGEKFMEYAQIIGMVLLVSLLLYANANDVATLFD